MSRQLALGVSLSDRASFATYIPGENGLAVNSVRACAGKQAAEPLLYLWGQPGTGKTHLLQAACRLSDEYGLAPVYVPLSDARRLAPQMLEDLERLDLVCLDDVDRIAGDSEWERALFNLFNRVRERNGRLLVSGPCATSRLPLELADLRSRLGWGVSYRIRELDEPGKLQVLVCAAERRGLPLAADAGRYLLQHYRRDLESLLNLLDQLDRASLQAQRKPTIPFLREQLKQLRSS